MTDVAVVVLDTVRADAFHEYFDWLPGTRFTRAYSTSHWTVPAHASLFTGQYASETGTTGSAPALDCETRTLAEAFRSAGYRTRGLTANVQLHQYDGWGRGFSTFDGPANLGRADDDIFDWGGHIDATDPGLERYLGALRRCVTGGWDTLRSVRYGYGLYRSPRWAGGARAIRRRVRETAFGDREFLFVNLMTAHTPYRPPREGADPVTVVVADALAGDVTDPERVRTAYRRSVSYLAAVYRDVFDALSTEFDYVVTLSDHGELLGEHGLWNHSIGLHPELVHVPLVVSGPDVPSGPRHEVVNLLDVHRTVGDLAGVDVDSRGRSLLGELPRRDLLVESHGLLPFHEGQFDRAGLPEEVFERWQSRLRGLLTGDGAYCYEAEPGRFRGIGNISIPAARERMDDLAGTVDVAPDSDGGIGVSDETLDRLRELGYA